MKRPCLPLPAVQAPNPTKILPTKCLNIAEPRIFCPPKITRYTVSLSTQAYNTKCLLENILYWYSAITMNKCRQNTVHVPSVGHFSHVHKLVPT